MEKERSVIPKRPRLVARNVCRTLAGVHADMFVFVVKQMKHKSIKVGLFQWNFVDELNKGVSPWSLASQKSQAWIYNEMSS